MSDAAPSPTQTLQSWLYYRDFGESLQQWSDPLRQHFAELFKKTVKIADLPDRLDNPPQSLREIIQKRLEDNPVPVPRPSHHQPPTPQQAIGRGAVVGVMVGLLLAIIFLLKTIL